MTTLNSSDASAAAKKAAAEIYHADRLRVGVEHSKANAGKLYLGKRVIEIVRKAAPDDLGFMETEACSAVLIVASGVEQVVQDVDIKTEPSVV